MSNSGFAFEPSEYWLLCQVLRAYPSPPVLGDICLGSTPETKKTATNTHKSPYQHASLALLVLVSAILVAGMLAPSVSAILAGDVNGDCKVNIFDLAAVGLAFGSTNVSGNWNPAADVKADGIIDIFDLASVGLAFGSTASPCTVPLGFRVNEDWSNINSLAGYDAVEQIGYYARPWGDIKYEDGNWALDNLRIWFIDVGGQVVGVIDNYEIGWYDFRNIGIEYGIRGDNEVTPEDEGAEIGDLFRLVAQNLSNNNFFLARFLNGAMLTNGFAPAEDTLHDIEIDRNSPIP